MPSAVLSFALLSAGVALACPTLYHGPYQEPVVKVALSGLGIL